VTLREKTDRPTRDSKQSNTAEVPDPLHKVDREIFGRVKVKVKAIPFQNLKDPGG
jgi:hypothetical protein